MQSVILYLIFGVLKTLVNILAYWLAAHVLGLGVTASVIIAWILAVLFAYFTNRKWVFISNANNSREILRELGAFFACRIFTGVLDILLMYIFVTLLNFNDLLIKALSNIAVIILNYLGSKFLIFK